MGYFSTGSEGIDYEEHYCRRCVHDLPDGPSCPCWMAHMLWNYDECNKTDSILHKMIPRLPSGANGQCFAFEAKKGGDA